MATFGKTLAELSTYEKNNVSEGSLAAKKVGKWIIRKIIKVCFWKLYKKMIMIKLKQRWKSARLLYINSNNSKFKEWVSNKRKNGIMKTTKNML